MNIFIVLIDYSYWPKMKYIFRYLNISFLVIFLASCSQSEFKKLGPTENKYNLTTESSLLDSSHTYQIDSLFTKGESGFFKGKNWINIFYSYFLQKNSKKGAIVISDGRTEAVVKYKEVIYDLFKNGYSVYIHDHRGQGFSERMLPDTDMGFVDEFQFYVDDMKYFYDNFITQNEHNKIFLLAHSMGSAIGVAYLEEYPDDFDAAAFSSPMLGLPFPTCLVVGLLARDEPEYALGNTNYDEGLVRFEENTLTGSEIRYVRMNNIFAEYPKARLGGATYQWVNKSCNQFKIIFDNIEKIETPLILFSGEEEEIVSPSSQNEFIIELNLLGKRENGFNVPGAKHELLIEKDEIRISVMTKILDFYSEFID